MTVENKFYVARASAASNRLKTLEEAVNLAKQNTVSGSESYVVYQAVSQTVLPVPSIEVVTL